MNLRTLCLIALVAVSTLTTGCLAGTPAKIVSPVSGDAEGPRSFDTLSHQVIEQSEELRLLTIRTRGLYPYYVNRYRVRLRIEEDGTISNVELLERGYLLPEFEDRFLEIVGGFEFSEYEGDPVELIYTFEFYPEAPKGALEQAAAKEKARRQSEDRAKAAEQPAAMQPAAVQIAPEAVMPAPPPEETAPEETPEAQGMAEPETPMEAAPADEPMEAPTGEEPAMMAEPANEEMIDDPEMEEGFDEADLEENSSPPKDQ